MNKIQAQFSGKNAFTKPKPKRWWLKTAVVSAAVSCVVNLCWAMYAHFDTHRSEASKVLWEKRQSAYADLLRVSARAAGTPLTADEYAKLHQEFYATSGAIEVYGTEEIVDCVRTLRDMLYACGHPGAAARENCDFGRFNRLHLRLSADARRSLTRTWDQHPKGFLDDRFPKELCAVK